MRTTQIIRQVVPLDPAPTGTLRKVDAIIFKAVEKDPARRYQSAREFGEDIDRSLPGEDVHARTITRL